MEESNKREMNNERNDDDKERENKSTQKSECNNCSCELSDPKETETEDNPKNGEPTTATCCEIASDVSETAKTEEQRQQENLCKNRRKCYEKSKECCQTFPKPREPNVSGKPKRKSRSTRRRLNALVSNSSSLHFSDTDSEDELLTTIRQHACNANAATTTGSEGPEISVTLEETQSAEESATNPNCLLTASEETVARRSRRASFVENLTDVDEFYPSESEADENAKENCRNNGLTVTRATAGETDVEDLSNDEADVPTVLVSPNIDLLCEFNGETITTTEGDGPFSVEIRNKIISRMDSLTCDDPGAQNSPDIVIMPTTDSEDIEMSDEDEIHEASCSQRELLEDLEALAASQIVMTNLNKVESASSLSVKDVQDDGSIGDCHTDVEDVD